MNTTALSPDDLRYLSMLAWRQGTRRAEEIADRIDAILSQPARDWTLGSDEPHPEGMSAAAWSEYERRSAGVT